MDSAISQCKCKLICLRIKELKDVLGQLGLSKRGNRKDLLDRILALFSDVHGSTTAWAKMKNEDVIKAVNDAYRKLKVSGIHDSATLNRKDLSEKSNVNIKNEAAEESFRKIRCLCGISLGMDPIVQCDDPSCKVWQHISCAIIPDKPFNTPRVPDLFFCELCRVARADPFRISIVHPLYPVKLTSTNTSTDGSKPVQSAERTFQLTKFFKDLLCKPEYDIQSWCMLLNDHVPFRMQWPQYAELFVNGIPVQTTNRPGSQLLGVSGRDDGTIITTYMKDGINKITLTGCDARIFCVGVRIIRRRTLQQILTMIPKESEGESFEDALTRVRRCVGGGIVTTKADNDNDLEIVSDSILVNLCCPMSASRIRVAGRFKPCAHIGCFDLQVFLEMAQRTRKWYCPICLSNRCLEDVVIDPYFNHITSALLRHGPDVTEVEVDQDGCWRLNPGSINGLDPGHWNAPYCSPRLSEEEFSDAEKPGIAPAPSLGADAVLRERENEAVIILTDSEEEEAGPVCYGSMDPGIRLMGTHQEVAGAWSRWGRLTGPVSLVPDSSAETPAPEVGDLVDNPLFGGADPSLQLFLPTADPSHGSEKRVGGSDHWISLRIDDPRNRKSSHTDPPVPDSEFPFVHPELLVESWGAEREEDGRPRCNITSGFPRQRRSVRPRLGF